MFAVCRRRDDGRVPRVFRAAAVVWLPARSDMKRRRWPGRAVHHYPVVVGQVRPPALGGVIGLSVTFLSGEHLASVVLARVGERWLHRAGAPRQTTLAAFRPAHARDEPAALGS